MISKEFELHFCEKVRALRTAQGLSLSELSRKSGVPLDLLRQMEQNILSDDFLVEHIFDLAGALGCAAYELCQ